MSVWGDEMPWKGEIPPEWALALSVIFAEFKGAKFNWHTMDYEKPKA